MKYKITTAAILCATCTLGCAWDDDDFANLLINLHAGHEGLYYQFGWTDQPPPSVSEFILHSGVLSCENTSCVDKAIMSFQFSKQASASWSVSGTAEISMKAELRNALIGSAGIGGRVSGTGTTGESTTYTITGTAGTEISPRLIKKAEWKTIKKSSTGTWNKAYFYLHCEECPSTFKISEEVTAGNAEGEEDLYVVFSDIALPPCD